ncbi:MAG: hypothetical protein J6N51_08070 [Selenomonas sp.]|nr:hypothetical protein [Selenomonas sp.]
MDNEKKTYTLTIEGQNSTITVENLTMNGTNYVSEAKVDTTAWPPTFKLTAKDEEGTVTEALDHAKLIQQEQYAWDGGKWYLAFAPVSAQEIENAKLQSQLEYIAMMTDVDLDA